MRTLLIIDGHYFLWRAYSVPFKFYSQKGTPLHVLTMYLKLIRAHIKAVEDYTGTACTHIAVAFDSNSPLTKQEIFSDYKANRKDISQDEENPYKHLPFIFKMLAELGIKYFMEDLIEGDELLGSVVKKFINSDSGCKCFIGSIDTDFYQLISERVNLVSLGKKESYLIKNPEFISHHLRITPDQYIYHKSLTGDKADNIPGVPNIGEVRASKIINKELQIDLAAYKDLIERNRRLICLNCDHELEFEVGELEFDRASLGLINQEIFLRCNF